MTPNVLTVTSDQSIAEVERILREHHIRRVPVVDDGKVVGIIAQGDICRAMPSIFNPCCTSESLERTGRINAGAIMTPTPITVDPSTLLEQAVLLMRRNKFGALPVVQDEQLVGIITETNIFNAMLEIFATRQLGVRIEVKIDRNPASFYRMIQVFKKCEITVFGITMLHDYSTEHQLVSLKVHGDDMERLIDGLWAAGLQINLMHVEEPPPEL